MEWAVEFTDELGSWFEGLTEPEQEDIVAVVGALEQRGPALGRPYVGTLRGSRHAHMKELRVQHDEHLETLPREAEQRRRENE